jgi:hypothetical protein
MSGRVRVGWNSSRGRRGRAGGVVLVRGAGRVGSGGGRWQFGVGAVWGVMVGKIGWNVPVIAW